MAKKIPHIIQFTVMQPRNEFEFRGEVLFLSQFGEYCPKNSMRGYSLLQLLDYPESYKPTLIKMNGINYEIPLNRQV